MTDQAINADARNNAIDATTRVTTLMALTEELTAIITRENALLEARRPQEISALQSDKARLAAAYAQSIRLIAADRSNVAGAGSDLIERLRELTRTFETHASHQRALLDGARAASESVMKAIAEEAGKSVTAPGYGAPGREAQRARDTAPLILDNKA